MNSLLNNFAERVFARHETFHPRYGWFRKAVTAAQQTSQEQDPFLEEAATVNLGVGKNMVRAIRFWGRAAKLITEVPNPQRPRMPLTVPTLNGLALFDDKHGLDPFLEFPGTLWLLHWWMLQPKSRLPVWWIAFHRFGAVEFTEKNLLDCVQRQVEQSGWSAPMLSSLRKDVSCFLRTYVTRPAASDASDETLDCPMRALGIIEPARGEGHSFRFVVSSKPSLPQGVLAYACLDWVARQSVTAREMTLHRIASEPGSPGLAFRMSERHLRDAFSQAAAGLDKIVGVTVRAGVPVLHWHGSPTDVARSCLLQYFHQHRGALPHELMLGDTPAKRLPVRTVIRSRPKRSSKFHGTETISY